MKQYISSSKRDGFTIVELLIVIVVIAILAAITIVSYNGITARANTTSAQAAATSALKKAEAYNAEQGSYPTAPSQLTGSTAQDKSYGLSGVTFAASTSSTSANNVLTFIACSSGAGVKIGYWSYVTPVGVTYLYGGTATSSNCTSATGLTT